MSDSAAPVQASRKRKRWPLVLGILVVLVIVLVALLPMIAGAFVPGIVADRAAERIQGRVEIEKVALGWFGTQRISGARLLEPDGKEVARADVELPGLWQLATSGGKRVRGVVVEVDANLVADESGATNLDRALAPRPDAHEPKSDDGGASGDRMKTLHDLDLEATLRVRKLAWSDPTTRAANQSVRIENARVHVDKPPSAPLAFELDAQLVGAQAGKIGGRGNVRLPSGSGAPSVDATIDVQGLSTALVDALARQHGLLQEALGDSIALSLKMSAASPDGAPIVLALDTPRVGLELAATITPRELRMDAGQRLVLQAQCGPALLERLLGAERVHALGLARTSSEALRVLGSELYVPLAELGTRGADAIAERARGKLELELGGWRIGATGAPSTLDALALRVDLAPVAGVPSASLHWSGKLDGHVFDGDVIARDLVAALAATRADKHAPFEVSLRTSALDTGSIEHLRASLQGPPHPGAAQSNDGASSGAPSDLRSVFGPTLALDGKLRATRVALADPLTLEFELGTIAQSKLTLAGDASLRASTSGSGFASLQAKLAIDGLRVYAERLAPQSLAPFVGLLGPALTLDVSANGLDAAERTLHAKLASGGTNVDAALTLGVDRVRTIGEQRVELDVPQFAWSLPANADGATTHVRGPIRVRASDLDVPLGDAARDIERLLGSTSGRVHVECAGLSHAASAAAAPIELRELVVDAALVGKARQRPLEANVSARLNAAGAADQPLSVRVDVNDVALALAAARGGAPVGFSAKCAVVGMPVGALEPLLGTQGRLASALGPALSLDLDAGFGAADAFTLVASAKGSATPRAIGLRATLSDLPALLAELGKPRTSALPLPPKLSATLALEALPADVLEAFASGGSLRAFVGDALDLTADVDVERAKPSAPLALRGKLRAGPTLPLTADFDVRLLELADDGGASNGLLPLRSLDANVSAHGMAAITSALAPASAAPYLALLGDDMKLQAKLGGADGEPLPLSLELDSGVTHVRVRGELAPARLKLAGDGLELSIAALPPGVWDAVALNLPPQMRIETLGALALRGRDLDLPVGGASLDPFAVLPLANGSLDLDVGGVRYVDASLRTTSQTLDLAETRISVALATGKPLVATAHAVLAGASSGALDATARVTDMQKLAAFATSGPPPLDVDAKVSGLSTALLDAWSGRKGMMPDILGERLDLVLEGRELSKTSGTLRVEMTSPLARAALQGRVGEAVLFSVEEQKTDLAFALTPLSSKRVVGSLVPMFVDIQPADPAQRASLVLSRFELPLDGDLAKLNGTATLDLGSVDFGFLPGIAELFGPALGKKAQRLGPYSLAIKNGVVAYDRLSIDVGGKPLSFSGRCDLGRSEFDLTVEVPLKYLGKDVSALLDKNRELLSPDLAVPLTVSGKWTKPKIGISKDFVKKVLEDAALGGLGGLLKDLGKKK